MSEMSTSFQYTFPRCNFDEQKIDVISTYFVRRNFDERNIDFLLMYFFQPHTDELKINFVLVYFLEYFRWKTDVTVM